MVVAVGVFTSYVFASGNAARSRESFEIRNNQLATVVSNFIESKITSYDYILLAMRAYAAGNQEISEAKWVDYTQNFELTTNFSALESVGYAPLLSPQEVAAFESDWQQENQAQFTVQRNADSELYAPIAYIAPFDTFNQSQLAYDILANEDIRAAIEHLDSGEHETALTKPTRLPGSTDDSIYMLAPVISDGQLSGYVFLNFKIQNSIELLKIWFDSNTDARFVLSDMTTDQTIQLSDVPVTQEEPSLVRSLVFSNRTWSIAIYSQEPAISRLVDPGAILILGTLTSMFLGAGIYYSLTAPIRLERKHKGNLKRTKDEILALTSHQLRTPASGVKQYVGMLMQGYAGDLTDEQQQLVAKAYKTNERQLEIINKILHVAKADANQLLLNKEDMAIAPLCAEVVDNFKEHATQKEIKLINNIKSKTHIYADPRYIRMILENLTSNAIKYSYPESRVTFSMTEDSKSIYIGIHDDGVGIKKSEFSKLFKKFSRLDNPLSQTEGGSGLGLFLAQRLARAHGGKIRISSTENIGSTFTLELPKHKKTSRKVM